MIHNEYNVSISSFEYTCTTYRPINYLVDHKLRKLTYPNLVVRPQFCNFLQLNQTISALFRNYFSLLFRISTKKKSIVQLILCIELGIFQNFQFILKLAREFETYVNKYHSNIEHCFKYTLFYVVFTNTFFSSVIPIWLYCVSSWFLFDSSYVLFFIQQISLIRKMMVAGIECFFSSFLIYIVCFKYLINTKKKNQQFIAINFFSFLKTFFLFQFTIVH